MRSPLRLYGRDDELATLESLLAHLWRGDGGALVLVAPPGLGRTALLRAAVDAHRDRGPVLYATATPAMRAVPCGALHALLGSAHTSVGPSPAAPPVIAPDALAGRLRELGAGRPLLVCADDAHTWDPASRTALAFAARGLGAGSRIAVLLSAADGTAFAGLPTLHLAPLDEGAASALLDRLTSGTASGADPGMAFGAAFGAALGAAPGSTPGTALGAALGAEGVDPVVRAELLREAAGNPRLLAGLAGHLTPDQLAGRTPLPFPCPAAKRCSPPTPNASTTSRTGPGPCSCSPLRPRSTSRTGPGRTPCSCCARAPGADCPGLSWTGPCSAVPSPAAFSNGREAGSTSPTVPSPAPYSTTPPGPSAAPRTNCSPPC